LATLTEPTTLLRREHRSLVRVVSIGLSLAVAAWLGYAFGRGQSLADVARLYRDVNLLEYTLDSGEMMAHYARTGGTLKPLLQAKDGTSLMDFSDWDYQSSVIVDGQRFEFVRLVPSDSVDYARNRIVAGLSSGDWVLSREITLTQAEADVQFTFVSNKPVHEVSVTIAHANWYYFDVRPTATGFVATLPRASRGDIESGLIRTPTYEVSLTSTAPGEQVTDFVRPGFPTPFGIQSVATRYLLHDPVPGTYVPVSLERVTWRRL
jgi:hypothetical protein